jgi:hypothetical protein
MSGGPLLEISTNFGQQAERLTTQPQVTFWKQVYRRHTNFAQEDIQVTFTGSVGFDKKMTATIPRSADLIYKMYLYATLPTLTFTTGTGAWTRNIGNVLIKSAKVDIGPTTIQEFSGIWMYVWHQVSEEIGHIDTYNYLTGNTTTLTTAASSIATANLKIQRPGLALPLLAISFADTRITIETRRITECVAMSSGAVYTVGSEFDASLWVRYIHLDENERLSLTQKPMEILYEDTQFTGTETITGKTGRMRIQHVHPIKSFYLLFNSQENQDLNRWTDFTDNGSGNNPYNGNNPLSTLKMQIYNTDRFSLQDGDYFNFRQPYDHFKKSPAVGINSYHHCLNPLQHQPSGTINMSKVDNAAFVYELTATPATQTYCYMFSVNYQVVKILNGLAGKGFAN